MELIKPSVEYLDANSKGLQLIELAGRTCTMSTNKITDDSAAKFVDMLIKKKHFAMIEFGWMCYKFVCNRGVTHEMVRHRLFSFAQRSTRWCNFSGDVPYIKPLWLYEQLEGLEIVESTCDFEYYLGEFPDMDAATLNWLHAMACSEIKYQIAIDNCNWKPQQARGMLNIDVAAEIVVAGNIREWRHFFDLRLAKDAHPQMIEVAQMAWDDASKRFPVVFDRPKGEK